MRFSAGKHHSDILLAVYEYCSRYIYMRLSGSVNVCTQLAFNDVVAHADPTILCCVGVRESRRAVGTVSL